MKHLWRRAAGIIKDRNSILISRLMLKSKHRDPELERHVIRATSHDDSCVDYSHAQRVFIRVQNSPSNLIIFLKVLTRRIDHTSDWVVTLKALFLLHGVFSTKAPGTRKIGRLPFDLSGFEEGYNREGTRRGAHSKFVLAYFGFLDLKSVTLLAELKDEMVLPMMVEEKDRIHVQMVRIKRWQDLLDAVLHVRAYVSGTRMTDEVVVFEALDCMVIEVFELYSKICDGIAKVLMKIYANKVEKVEASMALEILHKANKQGQDLSDYFKFCQDIGLLHAAECLEVQQIPEDDFLELEKIINRNGVLVSAELSTKPDYEVRDTKNHKISNSTGATMMEAERKDINQKPLLKTIITEKWEVFDEDMSKARNEEGTLVVIDPPFAANVTPAIQFNPFIDYVDRPSQNVLNLL